jgi:hypothetical protein
MDGVVKRLCMHAWRHAWRWGTAQHVRMALLSGPFDRAGSRTSETGPPSPGPAGAGRSLGSITLGRAAKGQQSTDGSSQVELDEEVRGPALPGGPVFFLSVFFSFLHLFVDPLCWVH